MSFGLLFFRHIGLFPNFAFSVVFGKTLLPKGAYRLWDFFCVLGKTLLCMANYLSSLGFWGFFSFLVSLYDLMILLGLSADGSRPHGGGGGGPLRFGRPQAPRLRRWPIAVRAAPGPPQAFSRGISQIKLFLFLFAYLACFSHRFCKNMYS